MSRGHEWWHHWFLDLAKHISTASKDPSTKCGAVIVRPDKTVAALGYNGFAREMDDSPEIYANREVKYDRIIHCEMNALLTAKEPVKGYTLYTYPFLSCSRCVVHMIHAGIRDFVAPTNKIERWEENLRVTRRYMDEVKANYLELEY